MLYRGRLLGQNDPDNRYILKLYFGFCFNLRNELSVVVVILQVDIPLTVGEKVVEGINGRVLINGNHAAGRYDVHADENNVDAKRLVNLRIK